MVQLPPCKPLILILLFLGEAMLYMFFNIWLPSFKENAIYVYYPNTQIVHIPLSTLYSSILGKHPWELKHNSQFQAAWLLTWEIN